MKSRILLGMVLTVAIGAWAADRIQPLNVKLGLWEMTVTMTNSGQMPIPPELLSKLTPEQRARLEERMKAQSGGDSKKRTYKSCLTREKFDKALAFGENNKNCTQTIITSTGSKIAAKLECKDQGMQSGGTMEFEAISAENVKGSAHMTASGGNRAMNLNSTYAGKWIGPACGNVK